MRQIKKILAPTDLSELSRPGVRYALETAALAGAEVIIYNVVGYHEATPYYDIDYDYLNEQVSLQQVVEEHRRQLSKFLRENFSDLMNRVTIREIVEVGTPYEKIIKRAADEQCDIIVLSTHGRTGLRHVLIGSVAEKVVRLAECPVLTVHPCETAARKAAA
jgi:nucleotide-binding universal stress UspA family protein